MNLLSFFERGNWIDLKEQIKNVMFRFPLTMFFMAFATISFIILYNYRYTNSVLTEQVSFFLALYPTTSILVSYVLHIWSECISKGKGLLLNFGGLVLWLGVFLYFTLSFPLNYTQGITFAIACASWCLGLIWIPFQQRSNDIVQINRFFSFLGNSVISSFLVGFLCGGLSILYLSFDYLFNINTPEYLFAYTFIVCNAFIAPFIILLRTPSIDSERLKQNWLEVKLIKNIIYFVLILLQVLYIITLYVYGIKILVTWTLPNGWVSTLVSVLVGLSLVITFLLYPSKTMENPKQFDTIYLKIQSYLVLPLLVLMTVGIGRRISDYGVTIARVYLLLFNLWCYFVFIGLIIWRTRRVVWVLQLFVAMALISTILPYNVYTFVKNNIHSDCIETIKQTHNQKLPMNNSEYYNLISKMGKDNAKELNSKLAYLREVYGKEEIKDILDDNTAPYDNYRLEQIYPEDNKPADVNALSKLVYFVHQDADSVRYDFPKDFNSVYMFNKDLGNDKLRVDKDTLWFDLEYNKGNKTITKKLSLSFKDIKEREDKAQIEPFIIRKDDAIFFITNLSYSPNNGDIELNIRGFILEQNQK